MAGGMTVIAGVNSTLEASKDGSTFFNLPFTGDITASGGDAPETDIPAYDSIGKVTGHPRVPSLSVAMASYVPNLDIWDTIYAAAADGDLITWRIRTSKRELHAPAGAGNTIGIAATGVVTFAGTDRPDFTTKRFNVGLVIEVGSGKYTVDSISSTGVVTVRPAPATAVAAASGYKIVVPSLELEFSGTVRSQGNFELPAEGNLATTLEITPQSQLPKWTIN